MSFDQFLRIIKARWILIAAVFFFVIIATLVVSLVMPKTYVAKAAVMADFRPDPISTLSNGALQPLTFITTQVDIIESDHVAQRVVTALKLNENPAMRESWMKQTDGKGDYIAWLASVIGKGLTVKPSRESNVIEIAYEGVEPSFAAALANAYARAYIDTTVQMKVDPARQYTGFFEERARLAREKLEQAQTKLAEAQREKGIVATDERLDVESARLAELSSQVNSLRLMKVEAATRSARAKSTPDDMTDVLTNPLIASIKADQSRLEAKLSELSAQYGSAHPSVIEVQANLDALRKRLRTETARLSSSASINANINSTREAEAIAEFEAQRDKVLKLKEARNTLQVLERDVEYAQRIYESIQNRMAQTSLESNSSQSGIYLLSTATEPTSAASPKLMLNMALAVALGILLSLLAALGMELFDRRVRGAQDFAQIVELPVIGVLPGLTEGRHLFGRNRSLFGAGAGAASPGKSTALAVSGSTEGV